MNKYYLYSLIYDIVIQNRWNKIKYRISRNYGPNNRTHEKPDI